MALIAILALALLLAAVWRLARLVVKLLLLGALIALIAGYGTSATPRRAPPPPARSKPPNQPRRPPGDQIAWAQASPARPGQAASSGRAEVMPGAATAAPRRGLGEAYEQEVARQIGAGADETAARCGMLDIAGVTVGAAFVGTFVIGDILRLLHGGQNYAVITLDLRSPAGIQAPRADCDDSPLPPYTRAR